MPLNPVPNWPPSLDSFPDPSTATYEDEDGYEIDLLLQKHNTVLERNEARWGTDAGSTTPDAIHKTVKATAAGTTSWDYHTKVKLGEATGTGSSGLLEVSGIPATFRHLECILVGRSDNASTGVVARLTFETSPTSGAYNHQLLQGAAAVASASENIGTSDYIIAGQVPAASSPAGLYGMLEFKVGEYANTAIMKPVTGQATEGLNLATGAIITRTVAGIWEGTAAIARVRLTLSAGNWTTNSRLTVYGSP